jgi:hypothetical protein
MAPQPDEKKKVNLTYVSHRATLSSSGIMANSSPSDPSLAPGEAKHVRHTRSPTASLPHSNISPQEDDTATAILKKKKKPNQLM